MIDAQLNIEQKIGELLNAGGWPAVEDFLGGFGYDDLTVAQREHWYQYRAVTAYRIGDRDLALSRYYEAVANCSENAQVFFGLGQELEHRGQIDEALAYFDAACFPKLPGHWSMVMIRYCYLWGRPDRGFDHLNPILAAVYQGRVIDDHYLHSQQLPFFGNLWRNVLTFSWQQGDGALSGARNILENMATDLVDQDLSYLFQETDALISGDFGPIIASLEEMLSRPASGPMGWAAMRMAVLKARTLDPADGRALVEAVALTQNDFPWLEDIRTMALAELMGREGRGAEEEELLARFRERQPLLFEPEHLVAFNLLEYNEKLRKHYIAERQHQPELDKTIEVGTIPDFDDPPADNGDPGQQTSGELAFEGIDLKTYAGICVRVSSTRDKEELPPIYAEFGIRDQAHFDRVNASFIAAMSDERTGHEVMARYTEYFSNSAPQENAGYLHEGREDYPETKEVNNNPDKLRAALDEQSQWFQRWAGIITSKVWVSMEQMVLGGTCRLEVGAVAADEWYTLVRIERAIPESQAICEEWVRRTAAEQQVEALVYIYYEPVEGVPGTPDGPLSKVLEHALAFTVEHMAPKHLVKVGGWMVDAGAGKEDPRTHHFKEGAWLTCCAVFLDAHDEEHWVTLLRQNSPERYDRSAADEVWAFSAWAQQRHGVETDFTAYELEDQN